MAKHVPLQQVLAELGWSCEQLIARVNVRRAKRGLHPLDRKSAYPWVRGTTRPRDDTIDDILATLSDHTGRTITDSDMGWDQRRPRTRRRALDNPYSARALELIRESQGDVPMHRRSFMLLAGAAVSGPALELLMGGAPAMIAAQNGDRVSPHLVESVEITVRQIRAMDDAEGSASALAWAGGIWQNLGRVLTESQYSGPVAARLQTAYIEMAETYGWMLFDSRHDAAAQRVYQTGLRLAREAEHDLNVHQATMNLLASAAYQATWLDQRQEAANMLNVATSRTPHALTSRLSAVLCDRQMALAGRTGDREQIRRLEAQTRGHVADADGSQKDPWWTQWLTSDMIDYQVGSAWLDAGDPHAAEPYLNLSATHAASDYPRDQMLHSTKLARARVILGDIAGAAEAAGHAHTLAGSIGSSRVRDQLDHVTITLTTHHSDHQAVRNLLVQHPTAV